MRNSSPGIRHSFISPGHNKTRNFTSSNVLTKSHDELSFTTVTSERATQSVNIQTPANTEDAKTSTQTVSLLLFWWKMPIKILSIKNIMFNTGYMFNKIVQYFARSTRLTVIACDAATSSAESENCFTFLFSHSRV